MRDDSRRDPQGDRGDRDAPEAPDDRADRDDGRWARVPVFALPEYTLFPHTLVPFHVFEPRYKEMLDECLATERLMVVTGLRPGWEFEEGPPRVHSVGGLGRVLSDRRFPDGRYNIFVHCIERVRITRTWQLEPYRLVDVERLPDAEVDALAPEGDDSVGRLFGRVMALASHLAGSLGDETSALSRVVASSDAPQVMSCRLASVVVRDAAERQRLLEETSVASRLSSLADHLGELVMRESPREVGWVN